MQSEASKSVSETFAGDEGKLDTVMKRIAIKNATIHKMRKISSLFSDEIPLDAKEADLISFFFVLSFDAFLKSGEIEKRLKALTEDN
ncbi:MAG: hypothetical protein PHP95_09335 [Desulfuromonadaceae bacterium]|nr:hypothetical protein [Desulfuromonadaceae bacterium]MDD2848646.1 hypothetical protein [Desulfuromonadaceae bacterium]MDD4130851.1 hypothetical protein [Desulfuromonadaceae bacterium]